MAASGNPLEEILQSDVDERHLIALASSLNDSRSASASPHNSTVSQHIVRSHDQLSSVSTSFSVAADLKHITDKHHTVSVVNSSGVMMQQSLSATDNRSSIPAHQLILGKPGLLGGGSTTGNNNQGLNQISDNKSLPSSVNIRNQTVSIGQMMRPMGLPPGSISMCGGNAMISQPMLGVTQPGIRRMQLVQGSTGNFNVMSTVTTSNNLLDANSNLRPGLRPMQRHQLQSLAAASTVMPGGGIVFQQNGTGMIGNQQQNIMRVVMTSASTATTSTLRTLAPRIILNSSGGNIVQTVGGIRIQQPNMQTLRPAQQIAGQLSLAPNFQIPPGMVMVKNEQGGFMLVPAASLQNQAVRLTQTLRPGTPTLTQNLNVPTTPSAALIGSSAAAVRQTAPVIVAKPGGGVFSSPKTSASGSLEIESLDGLEALTDSEALSQLDDKDIVDDVKKCKNFLSTLLKLAGNQPQTTVYNVCKLIQGLVDGTVLPLAFTTELQKELSSSPQPYLVPFLKKSLPLLRYSLSTGRMSIDGILPPQPGTPAALAAAAVRAPSASGAASSSMGQIGSIMTRPMSSISTAQAQAVASSAQSIRMQQAVAPRMSTTFLRVPGSTTGVPTSLTHEQIVQVAQAQQLQLLQQQRMKMAAVASMKQQTQQQQQQQASVAGTPVNTPSNHMNMAASVRFSVSAGASSVCPAAPAAPAAAVAAATISHAAVAFSTVQQKTVTAADRLAPSAEPSRGDKRKYDSIREDDDINDVATMGGVNLSEESNAILATNSGLISGQLRSTKDERLIDTPLLLARISAIAEKHGLAGGAITPDVAHVLSHAVQQRISNLLEKASVVSEHRLEMYKSDERFEVTNEVKGQLKFMEELEGLERKRHEEAERGVLLRAAKSRSKLEDPEQAKLKEKAKALQAAELEEMRQKEANLTALIAIGPRRQRRDASLVTPGPQPVKMRPRTKRVTLRDLQFVLEEEPQTSRSQFLFQLLLK